MDDGGFFPLIVIGGLGLLFLVSGTLARLGVWRSIYAVKGYPVFMPRELGYVGIPIALMTLSLWLILVLPITKETRGNLISYVFIPLLIITYILAIWQPWWLKPAWLRWLEQEHGDILELLWEEVRKDRWGWERRVRTQTQLETWAADVRRKHGIGARGNHIYELFPPVRMPNFLKPRWLRWLEAHYPPEAISLFELEWQKMDRKEWVEKITTEAGVKKLVQQIIDKYGEYDPEHKVFANEYDPKRKRVVKSGRENGI